MHYLSANGIKYTFAELGITKAKLSRKNRASDILSISSATNFAEISLQHAQTIELFEDQKRRFSGNISKITKSKNGKNGRNITSIIIKNAWAQLESIVYQQLWKSANTSGEHVVLSDCWRSKVVLGYNSDGIAISPDSQLSDILSYAISCGANFQIGNIDCCENIMLSDELTDASCAEAIARVLKWFPDSFAWFDYSNSSDPILNIGLSGNLETTIISSENDNIINFSAAPRNDLRVDGVAIKYESENSFGDFDWITLSEDIYPTSFNPKSSNAIVMSVALGGSNVTRTVYTAVCETIYPESINWWKKKIPSIGDIENAIVISYSREHENLPRELTEGTIPNNIGYTCTHDVISAVIEYTRASGESLRRCVKARILATNASTGSYSRCSTKCTAENVPQGVAKAIYDSTQNLLFDGEFTITGSHAEDFAKTKISANGFGENFTAMNAPVMSIVENIGENSVMVKFGPPKHLFPDDIAELFRINKSRTTPSNGYSRSSGKSSISTSSEFDANVASSPLVDNETSFSRFLVTNSESEIDIDSDDLSEGETASFREIYICKNGEICKAKILMTEPIECSSIPTTSENS